MMTNGHELRDFTFQFIYLNCSVYLTQNIDSKNYHSLFLETLLSVKVEHLFSDSWWDCFYEYVILQKCLVSYYLLVMMENGGGDDDDGCNDLFYINNKHLPHVHYMRISTPQWWVLLL